MARTKKTDTATFDQNDFLAMTVSVIRMDGWISGGEAYRAEAGTRSTAQLVWDAMKADCWRGHEDCATFDDHLTAKAAVDWIASSVGEKSNPSEFDQNLVAALVPGRVTQKSAGMIASLISIYNRHLVDAKANAKDVAASAHVGIVGDKITVEIVVTSVNSFFGRYGETTIYKMRDASGNVFTWFSSAQSTLHKGAAYSVTGTVKKHDEFRGVKQTVITRCKASAA